MTVVGKNILENLTTGMYSDSKIIYREYIQNACDQIDLAKKQMLLGEKDGIQEGVIDIYIDPKERRISIKDNATGVEQDKFIDSLGDIANSDKELGKNKGFRGIGRLCGLAYCKTLKFTTSYSKEKIKSIMTIDAELMRKLLADKQKYTLQEVWSKIVSYDFVPEEESLHYFNVELIEINQENTDLLDVEKIRKYLSFVAPVPYSSKFIYRNRIHDHAQKIHYPIDEYTILVNGKTILKDYGTKIKEPNGTSLKNIDEIFDIEFKDFYDDNNNLIAWLWYGLSTFDKQIPKVNDMRGLRLRSGNIQIGDDNVLTKLFREPRGNYYFIGEVFAVDKELIPNSQRNYFNENPARVMFEKKLRNFFYDELHRTYHKANEMKNMYKKHEKYVDLVKEYNNKSTEGFIDDDEEVALVTDIKKAKGASEKAEKKIERLKDEKSEAIRKVFNKIEKNKNGKKLSHKAETATIVQDQKNVYATDSLSKLNRKERKLVSRIMSVITDVAPSEIAEEIIEAIKEEFK